MAIQLRTARLAAFEEDRAAFLVWNRREVCIQVSAEYRNGADRRRSDGDDCEQERKTGRLSAELIQQTRDLWQSRTSRRLTDDDAREIIEKTAGFVRLLQKWKRIETRAVNDHAED